MKTVLPYLKKYVLFALAGMLFMVAEVSIDLIQPRMMAEIVDNGILGAKTGGVPDIDLVISTGIRMILYVALGGFCGIMSGVFVNIVSQNCGNHMRKDCFSRIMNFSYEQIDLFSPGSLITRITNDVGQVQNLFAQMMRGVVRCGMFFVGGTYALLSLDMAFWKILAIAFPLLLANVGFFLWKTAPMFNVVQEKMDNMNNVVQEDVAGSRVIKAFIQEEHEKARFGAANDDLSNTHFKVMTMLSFMRPIMNIVLNLAVVAIIYIGGLQVKAAALEPGSILAAITYISQILSGVMMLAMIFQTVTRGMVSAKRIEEVLLSEPALADGAVTKENAPAKATKGASVEFRHASFSYPGSSVSVLKDINLRIEPGEVFAIIGSTGCGKSSLVNLIPRFYDVTEGEVLVDGINVKDYAKDLLREKVTICLQKSELFSTTIKDNISLGKRSATDEEISLAAKSAQAEDFILQQSSGYDTSVAQGGMSLSGGQKQRVAISRALLRNSEVLILDDSTSALDLKTEAALYKALDTNYEGVTRIIIAQRIASVKNAARIAVIDGGTIAAVGTHEELLRMSPVYIDICNSQLKQSGKNNGTASSAAISPEMKGGLA